MTPLRRLSGPLVAVTLALTLCHCSERDRPGGVQPATTFTTTTSTGDGGSGGMGGGGGGTGGAGGQQGDWYRPPIGTTWQWQLSGLPVDPSYEVEVYDVDLFTTTLDEIAALHQAGHKVICYFSAGSYEQGRPDSSDFPAAVKGSPLDPPFEDELWLDIRDPVTRAIMSNRMTLAASNGCDAVEPDNVDGYDNDNGFGLTAADQLDYNKFIAKQAHALGMSVGLKNDLGQLDELVDHFDWALNEECWSYAECDAYESNFLAKGKAVFHAEYVAEDKLAAVCSVTKPLGLSTLLKHIELDAWQLPCP